MINLRTFFIKTHSSLANLVSDHGVLCQTTILFGVSFWVSVSALFLTLIRLINKAFFFFFFSVRGDKVEEMDKTKETEESEERETDMLEFKDAETDTEEPSKLVFKFEYQTQTFEKLSKEGSREEDDCLFSDSVPSSSTVNKYETVALKDLIGFIEKQEDVNLTVDEFCSESVNGSMENKEFLLEKDFLQEKSAGQETKDSVLSREEDLSEKAEMVKLGDDNDLSEVIRFLSENDFVETTDSDSGTIDSSHEFTSRFIASTSDGFLSDSDFEDESFEAVEASTVLDAETSLSEDNSGNKGQNGKKPVPSSDLEDDSNGLESLWEHQDLIEQLKMELKKVKAVGLPTILEEESDCPKLMEDLKPWKIDEKKFQHVDTMGELHKFYKSYRERMRKFDILNYQKMYALGLLQSKDPLQAITAVESSPPGSVASVLSWDFRLCRPRKSETEPMVKFIRELHSELENVYVGQLCLSWEILHWQYEKAIELWESDAYDIRRYNEVAGEFQQFQVLVQRFMENEAFEGPRVQNYVKRRCVLRNLLQVPVIREDGNKDKRKARRKFKDDADEAITSDKLLEMMEESIRLFWRFVQADKFTNSIIQKTATKTRIEPQDPEELEMLVEIKATLQKKEKKLKDVLRSGNCILRKFQKHHEEDSSEQVLQFFSQVDMKLVTRVLNMSKLTRDHLVWCHNKLNKIHFVNRKIHVEPSFCLFPC